MEQAGHPIVIEQIHKSFADQKVLNGITLRVSAGETVAVLGRSGTGKSVLLRLMIRLLPIDLGSICVMGEEINTLNEHELYAIRKKVGFLFQQAALYDSLTVRENVAFPLARHVKKITAAERDCQVRELLASVEMDRDLDKLPSQISGGMQKRVGLARALVLNPEVLLFDEPTAGLDPITANEISNLILELKKKRKMTALVVTHDIRAAKLFADRLVFLHEGRVIAEGTFADLRKGWNQFVRRFLREDDS